MDGILEAHNFYRKHVAGEPDALFRAVSDAYFKSQAKRNLLALIYSQYIESEEGIEFMTSMKEQGKDDEGHIHVQVSRYH